MIIYKGKQEKRARGPLKCFSGYGRENDLQLPGKIPDQRIARPLVYNYERTAAAAAFFFSSKARIIDIGRMALVWSGFLVYACLVYILLDSRGWLVATKHF